MTELTIPSRFSGPPTSANGGYTAGLLAAALAGGDVLPTKPIEVTLRKPPPMEVPIPLTSDDDTLFAGVKGAVVAEAKVYDGELRPVAPASYDEAAAAEASYPGLSRHPFPRCFVCGPDRPEGDGLRIFPGQIGETDDGLLRVAATWTPGESVVSSEPGLVSLPATWAALDCTGGWAADLTERWMVLGRLTGLVHSLPALGEPHVVVGEGRAMEGRKAFTATSLYDDAGTLLATAEHVWISVDPSAFS